MLFPLVWIWTSIQDGSIPQRFPAGFKLNASKQNWWHRAARMLGSSHHQPGEALVQSLQGTAAQHQPEPVSVCFCHPNCNRMENKSEVGREPWGSCTHIHSVLPPAEVWLKPNNGLGCQECWDAPGIDETRQAKINLLSILKLHPEHDMVWLIWRWTIWYGYHMIVFEVGKLIEDRQRSHPFSILKIQSLSWLNCIIIYIYTYIIHIHVYIYIHMYHSYRHDMVW